MYVPQQVRREDLGDMETDHLAWKQFSKLIDVRERGGGGGNILVRQKWSPPASPEGGDMQTDHLRNSFQS